MKMTYRIAQGLALLALSTLNAQLSTVFAQGTAFSYQGRLNDGANPANGIYDLRFTVYDSTNSPGNLIAGPLTNSATGVTNGLFTVTLDFGPGVFTGPERWLELDVRTNGNGAFTTLLPFQPILPMPYSIMANTASNLLGPLPAAQLSGTLPSSVLAGYSGTVTLTNGGNSFSGSFGGNGAGLTNVPGSFLWQVVSGTSVQALPNTGYILTNAQVVTVTLPASPKVGDIVRVVGTGATGWQITTNASQTLLAGNLASSALGPWAVIQSGIAGNPSCAALSADSTQLAVGGSGIYTSTNLGASWIASGAPATNQYVSIASSSNGTRLVALGVSAQFIRNSNSAAYVSFGGIYISTNSGTTWGLTSAPTSGWTSVASSADGTHFVAAALPVFFSDGEVFIQGGVYVSANSGATWSLTSVPVDARASPVASSADGNRLVAVEGFGSGFYVSTNAGTTWNLATISGANNLVSVALSADGTRLAAADALNGVYISTNAGATWALSTPPTLGGCSSIAFSSDGTHLFALLAFNLNGPGDSPNEVWASNDSGTFWFPMNAPNDNVIGDPYSIACSADGAHVVVVGDGDGLLAIYPAANAGTGTSGFLFGSPGAAVELLCIGGGQFVPISSTGTVSPY